MHYCVTSFKCRHIFKAFYNSKICMQFRQQWWGYVTIHFSQSSPISESNSDTWRVDDTSHSIVSIFLKRPYCCSIIVHCQNRACAHDSAHIILTGYEILRLFLGCQFLLPPFGPSSPIPRLPLLPSFCEVPLISLLAWAWHKHNFQHQTKKMHW